MGKLIQIFLAYIFFLPPITDRSKDVNQYLKNGSITPLDIKQDQLNVWAQNSNFDPAKLDMYGGEKKVMADAILSCLKHVALVSNSNLVQNADGLLCRRKEDVAVYSVGGSKVRAPPEKFKLPY